MKWTRRKFVGGLLAAAAGTYVDMKWVEPEWLSIGRHEVRLAKPGKAPLRLLHLSDLHASEAVRLELIEKAVSRGLQFKPDVVCLTGDFISWRYDAFRRYGDILKPLADAAPAFAVLGNHDGGHWVGSAGYSNTDAVRTLLERAGIEVLHNRAKKVQLRGRELKLVGVGDLWAGEMDAPTAFGSGSEAANTILLCHNPDAKEALRAFPWELMLCGHTHGGQCDLVFMGTPFAPVSDKRFVRGLHYWCQRWIHITKGVGNLHGLRLNCRPEVSLLTLT